MGLFDDMAPAGSASSGLFDDLEQQKSGLLRRAVGDTSISLLKGAISVPEAMVGLADIPTGGIAGKAAEQIGFNPKEAKATLDEYLSPEQKAANARTQAAEGFIDTAGAMLENPSTIWHTGMESVPAMLGGGVVARGARALPGIGQKIAPWAAGAIGEGTVSAGLSAEQIRQQTEDGLLTPTQSGLAALTGAGTGVLGAGGAKLANRLGVGEIDTLLAGGATQATGKGVARRAAEGALVEGAMQELPQSMQEQALQNIALGKPWDEGVGAAAAAGLLTGGVIGGIAGPLGKAQVQPAPSAENPNPAPVPAPDPNAGPISRAALGLPAPSIAGALPAPDTLYADSQGNVNSTGPVRNVDGTLQPDVQARAPWVNPGSAARTGGAGMDQPVERGAEAGREGDYLPASRFARQDARQGQTIDGQVAGAPAGLPAPLPRIADGRQDALVVDAQGNVAPGKLPTQARADYVQGGRGMDQPVMPGQAASPRQRTTEPVAAKPGKARPVLQNRDRSTPASITQMREIAARPDYSRLGFSRDFGNGAPVVEPGAMVPKNRLGRSDTVTTATGRKIPVQYAVIEAGALLPSHDVDGSPMNGYEAGIRGKSRAIAGNGRVAALRQAHDRGTAKAYVAQLLGDDLHGISPAVIKGMKRPVLVRIMPQSEVTQNIGDESNIASASTLSGAEQAVNDARRIDIASLEFGEGGEIGDAAVRQFIQAMPKAEQNTLLDGSTPSRQAFDRMASAVFASAYESDALVRLQAQATDPEVRTVLGGLLIAAPKMAQMKGHGQWDIRGLVVEAAETAVNARRNGQSLSDFAAQADFARSPEAQYFIDLFAANSRSAKRIGDALAGVAELFYSEAIKPETDMFGAVPKRARLDLLGAASNEAAEGESAGSQPAGQQARPGNAEQGRQRPAANGTGQAAARADAQPEDLELTTQTEQELAAQAAAQADAAAQAAAKAKAEAGRAQADKDRGAFTLTGSDRPSDIGAAAGQGDIFASKPAPAPASITGADIDGDWTAFTQASGTLGIPRADMPQIRAEHRGAMVNFLNARGIAHEADTVPAADLKPTQAEFSRKKVAKAKAFDGGDRSILISKDGHVLDGHHQWLASRDTGEDVKVIRLDAPIKQLLDEMAEFPSAGVDEGAMAAPGQARQAASEFPLKDAAASYAGISHSGSARAKSDAEEFTRYIDDARESGLAVAHTDAQKTAVAEAVAELRAEYLANYRRLMNVRAGTYSGYVAGGSKLNSKQANSRNNAYDRAIDTFTAWQSANAHKARKAALDARTEAEKAADQAAADQAREDKAQKERDGDLSLMRKILSWKKGGEPVAIGKGAVLDGVNKGRDGYPTSIKLKPTDGSTLTDDKFDLAALFRDRKRGESVPASKRRVRELVDAVRAEDATQAAQDDAQQEQAPAQAASKIPLLQAHEDAMEKARDGKIDADEFRAAFAQAEENREAILAELNSMNKEKLLRAGGVHFYHRYKTEKKDKVVEALHRSMLDEFALGKSYGPNSYMLTSAGMASHREARAKALRELVANTDAAALQQYANEVAELRKESAARKEATQKALTDPQTLSEFRSAISYNAERHAETRRQAYLRLTPEQRRRYDALEAESTRDAREQAKAKRRTQIATAGNTTASEVIASKHTKYGHDLFVVKLADKIPTDEYRTLLASAKRMGGNYSSYRGNGAIPGFQFRTREAAEAFRKLVEGDTADAQAIAQERRDAFEDDRSQSAVERLRTMAAALNERADEDLNRDRKTNTARRARMASAAEGAANANKALAGTMSNIAEAIESGSAKFLDLVRQKVQVEFLGAELRNAKDAQIRAKYPSYADQERHRGAPVDEETVDYSTFPTYGGMRSDLAGIARQMIEVDGLKNLGARLMKVADDVSDAYVEWAKQNLLKVSHFARGDQVAEFASRDQAELALRRAGLTDRAIVLPIKRGVNRIVLAPSEAMKLGLWQGDGDKRIELASDFGREIVEAVGRRAGSKIKLPWQLETVHTKRKRLESMGIYTGSEFRAALREFAEYQQAMATPNKIKQMERAMVGRRSDGLDFFPTSEAVVDAMLEAAEIEEGMAVLEPSAGMGHIADAIREKTGAEPDVVELSGERRELLSAKGYNLVGDDFTALTPRSFYTFGDVFQAPDGTRGIMHGGAAWSGRASLHAINEDGSEGKMLGWYDRDDLTGIEHRGSSSGYDRIVMNPPFSKGRDIQHVMHAYGHLKPGGRLVAIMGEGAFFRSNKDADGFRAWLDELGATSERLPENSFMDAALPVNTAVNARLVVIDKPAVDDQQSRYRLNPGPAKGIPLFSARAIASKIAKATGLKLETVANEEALPAAVRAQIERDGVSGRVAGVYHNGTSYLIASNLRDTKHAISTVLHEAVGHGGIKAVLGDKIAHTMRHIYRDMPSALRSELERRYAGQTQGLSQEDAQALIAEEYVAHLAETDPKHGVIGRLVALLRQFIRNTFGEAASLKWTRGDLVQLLAEARQAAGRDGNGGGSRYSAAEAMPADLPQVAEASEADFVASLTGSNAFARAIYKAQGTDSPFFRRWFGKSRMVDKQGRPVAFVHRSYGERDTFDDADLGGNTGTPTAALGHFLARRDVGNVERYGPVSEQFYVRMEKPKVITQNQFEAMGDWSQTKVKAYRKTLMEQGHDGLYIQGLAWPVVFEGKNIKAARNSGTFDDSVSTRYSLNDDAATTEALRKFGLTGKAASGLLEQISNMTLAGLKDTLGQWSTRAEEGLFDGLAGIKRAEEAVGIKAADLQGYVSARLSTGLADVMHGVLHYAAPEWRNGVVAGKEGTRGVLDILADLGQDNLTPWLAWLGAKRAQMLKAQGRENNLSDQDIAELLAMGKGKEALFEKVYREYAQVNEAVLDMAEQAGLVDKDVRAKWATEYYVPFYRADETDGLFSGPRTKRGLSHQAAGIKALKGGKLPTQDLLANILMGWTKRIDASMKNKALMEVVDNLKDSEFLSDESLRYQQVLVSRSQIAAQIRKDRKALRMVAQMLDMPEGAAAIKVVGELMKPQNEGFEKLWTQVAPTDPDIIRLQRGGKNEYYRVNDEGLLRGLKFIEGSVFNDPVTRMGRAFKRLLTTGVTASPDFILRNFIRDAAHAWMINKDGFRLATDSFRGMRDALKEDKDYRDLMFAGASFQGGYVHGGDPEAAAQIIRRALEKKGFTSKQQDSYLASLADTPAKAANMLAQGWQKYREIGDKVENANRLATYKAALAAGKSPRQAAFEARDLMDYSMRGNFAAAQWFTDMVPFLNARLQGLYKLGRATRGEQGKWLAKEVAMKGGYLALFSLALAAMNGDDDRYKQLKDWDKDANWHFWFSADQVEPFRIPKPFELGLVFGTLPERLLHALTGNQEGGDLAKAVAHGVFQTLAFNPVPQFYQPIREVQANRNFFMDMPIEGLADEGKLPEARYDSYTSAIGKGLGQLTGPTLGVSPKQLDHLIKGYTGTLGGYILGMSNLIASGFSDAARPAMSAGDIPVLKVLYQGDAVRGTQYQTDFYDMLGESEQIYRTARSFAQEGSVEQAQALLADNRDKLKHRAALGLARQQLGAIRKRMDAIYRDTQMDGDTKREQLNDLQRRSNQIAERVVKRAKPDF